MTIYICCKKQRRPGSYTSDTVIECFQLEMYAEKYTNSMSIDFGDDFTEFYYESVELPDGMGGDE